MRTRFLKAARDVAAVDRFRGVLIVGRTVGDRRPLLDRLEGSVHAGPVDHVLAVVVEPLTRVSVVLRSASCKLPFTSLR